MPSSWPTARACTASCAFGSSASRAWPAPAVSPRPSSCRHGTPGTRPGCAFAHRHSRPPPEVGRGPGGMVSIRSAHWLRRLESQFLRPYRWPMALGLVGLFAQSILLLPIPLLQGWVLDRLIARPGGLPVTASAASRAILLGLLASIACHLGRMALAWKVATNMGRISQEVVAALRAALHRKLMRLPMAYFDVQQTGRLMARVTSDVGSIFGFLNVGSLQLVNDLILALGIAALLVWVRWSLALVALIIVPLYAVNQRVFSRKVHQLSGEIRAQVAAIY